VNAAAATPQQYSEVADEQLDELEATDPETYNDVLKACESVFEDQAWAHANSSAIHTNQGIRFRLPVEGRRHKVVWSSDGPRIEACSPTPDAAHRETLQLGRRPSPVVDARSVSPLRQPTAASLGVDGPSPRR